MNSHKKTVPAPSRLSLLITGMGFLILYIPLVTMVVLSFVGPGHGNSFDAFGDRVWTLKWYRLLFDNKEVWDALRMSLVVGFWSTLGSTVLGTAAALAVARTRFPGRRIFDVVAYLPLIMPEIVLGIALLVWFVLLKVSLGGVSIILAHITFSMSYVMMTVKSRLADFDTSLEEAARDLGATPWFAFWKVTFPLIWPGILSGALMAFTLSFDDFLITFFTAGVGSDTLPLKIYSMIKFGVSPEINALSTLILLVTLILVAFLFQPMKNIKLKKDPRGW